MDHQVLWLTAAGSFTALIGVFLKMKKGFGPNNLKAVGIVLIAFLASTLSIAKADNFTATMGLLGAIAGYLFGSRPKNNEEEKKETAVGNSSSFGDYAKVAGRDINESINNLYGQIAGLEKLVERATTITANITQENRSAQTDLLITTVYQRQLSDLQEGIRTVVEARRNEGWRFRSLSSDYQGMDGIFLVFDRPSLRSEPEIIVTRG